MKFIVQIDEMRDDRPSGSVTPSAGHDAVPFEGWVELLRALERAEAAQFGSTPEEGTPS